MIDERNILHFNLLRKFKNETGSKLFRNKQTVLE